MFQSFVTRSLKLLQFRAGFEADFKVIAIYISFSRAADDQNQSKLIGKQQFGMYWRDSREFLKQRHRKKKEKEK